MAKATSLLVLPIIFLVLFALVEQNMGAGCMDVLGSCGDFDCTKACKSKHGPIARAFCDRDYAAGRCICTYPCPGDKTHM
ncbi:hypothetical protein EUTSA_v10026709mg [Eutrema salsugineum]|uniref:Defensin-like protein n=1 Tax=Eutrema salsugineum TaxID=72664 RepID=V4MCQ5_EUTSA|nr:defensin-like protein 171 [Eutrema salsugineum]ESQ54219.1 hypothetical protein EUTSA_v10026709mg [Eutrema salsugineum]